MDVHYAMPGLGQLRHETNARSPISMTSPNVNIPMHNLIPRCNGMDNRVTIGRVARGQTSAA